MTLPLCLLDATVLNWDPAEVRPGVNLRIADGVITALGPDVKPEPGDEAVDLHGQVVIPGLVVGHHHLYSALARGMPGPSAPPVDFPDTLRKIWWRLDRALDAETNELSAAAGALDAARCGITGIIDHHASPSAVAGSLDRIAAGISAVGLRALLCYETSDRDGQEVARAGLEENRRFQAEHAADPMLRGLIGAHASFTVGDETLDRLAELCHRTGAGLHIHLLEDASDRALSLERYGADPVSRLASRGLLGPKAIVAHGVHLTEAERETVKASGAAIAHNPRSNMNNRVGATAVAALGDAVILGTDGIDGDILEEARAMFFRGREHATPLVAESAVGALMRASRFLERYFGGRFGGVAAGAAADLSILDYDPATPLTPGNAPWHLAFGWGPQLVRSTIVAGRFVLRDHAFVAVDAAAIRARARAAAPRLWEAMSHVIDR